MTTPYDPCFFFRDEAGHSLIEAVVATALVTTVLLPLSGMGIALLTARQNEPILVATALARQFMEETLYARSYQSRHVSLDRGRWRVEKTITRHGNQVVIVIRVFRRSHPHPLAEVMTVRLLQ